MTQHYILYKNSNSDLGQNKNKIDNDTVDKLLSNRESSIK